jgi:hypothetical protein
MTKLSDTQLVILTAACSRDDRRVLPLPASLKGGAANKVINSLMTKGMVAEIDAGPADPVWRTGGNDRRTTLRATDAAFAALNLEPHEAATAADDGQETDAAGVDAAQADEALAGPAAPATRKVRAGTKQAQLIEMLKRPEGATIDEIVAAFGWQPHTVRGAIAGALKKNLGLMVNSEKVENRGRVYRIG